MHLNTVAGDRNNGIEVIIKFIHSKFIGDSGCTCRAVTCMESWFSRVLSEEATHGSAPTYRRMEKWRRYKWFNSPGKCKTEQIEREYWRCYVIGYYRVQYQVHEYVNTLRKCNWKPFTSHNGFKLVNLSKMFCHKLGNLEWAANKVPTQHSQVRSLTVIYTDHGDLFILLVMILWRLCHDLSLRRSWGC